MAKIGDVCASKIDTLNAAYNGKIDYIDISAVDNDKKKITNTETLQIKEAPSRARQLVEYDDIIVSLVRPNLNAVAVVENSSENLQVASTGYCVLRCNQAVYSRYLFYFCQSETFINRMTAQATGASYPAVSNSIVKNCEIPLPERNKQKEIADILDKVTGLISLRKQQLAKLDELVKARFVEMFGNPKDNKKEWNRVPLKKVAEVRGRVGWKGYKKEDLQESGPLVLGATHLTENGNIDLSSPVYLSRDKYEESPEIMLHRNDLVFTQRGNTIGKVGLVKEDIGEATINPCVLILRPTNIHPIYLDVYFIMDEVKKDMWRLNAGSAQPMITQKGISEYLLMLPPIELQNQFAAFVERVDKQKQTVQQSLEKLELMKKALMQEYFG